MRDFSAKGCCERLVKLLVLKNSTFVVQTKNMAHPSIKLIHALDKLHKTFATALTMPGDIMVPATADMFCR